MGGARCSAWGSLKAQDGTVKTPKVKRKTFKHLPPRRRKPAPAKPGESGKELGWQVIREKENGRRRSAGKEDLEQLKISMTQCWRRQTLKDKE